jgi:23S rRNA pseudouridine2605 synthase
MSEPTGVRLQKVLAQAGVASRRAAEELISAGRVEVDGEVVTELGRRVDPDTAVIHVDGSRIVVRDDLVHLALNKPRGVHSTMSDEQGRPCVGDYVRGRSDRLFHVGRLDADTEGLLLLTNDGELSHRLMHPSFEVLKTYVAQVAGQIPRDLGKRLRAGITLEDGPVAVHSFRVVDATPGRTMLELVLHEGRKHIVRRLLDAAGHPVQRLVRTQIGPVRLGEQRPGSLRPLTRTEVGALYQSVGL